MGEIAEMMLNGDLCEGCGDALGDNGDGFTRRCASCDPAGQDDEDEIAARRMREPTASSDSRELRRWNDGKNYGAAVNLAIHHPKQAALKITRLEKQLAEMGTVKP